MPDIDNLLRYIWQSTKKMNKSELVIRNCVFAYECKGQWEKMEIIDLGIDQSMAFCQNCQREVYLCETDDSLLANIKLNRCVALRLEGLLSQIPRSIEND
jgi:hypothetical protein